MRVWLGLWILVAGACTEQAASPDTGHPPDGRVVPDASFAADSGRTPDASAPAADSGRAPDAAPDVVWLPPPPDEGIYGYAGGCYTIEAFDGVPSLLAASPDGETFQFADGGAPAQLHMRAADLGTYLFYDTERHYFAAEAAEAGAPWRFSRLPKLASAVELLDDAFVSPAEWQLEPSERDSARYQLRHRASGRLLARSDLTDVASQAAIITLRPGEGCAEFPELSLDAIGAVVPRTFEDGDLYGIAEIHAHLMTNFGFGGGGIFHGAPFHRLGVEHALPDCAAFHGPAGRKDLVGYFYDGGSGFDLDVLLPIALTGQATQDNHRTAGYPQFTDWPNARLRATHQTLYYRWLERARLAGLRLLVQHATGNSVLCELITGLGSQAVRYSCNDMVSVDRQIAEVREMERYIDAQSGGPGQGWFRVVESPARAREVIRAGKLAVVLGIEISNLFDCFSTPRVGTAPCTPESVAATVDHYRDLGVRVVFPVHKYDNAFSAGDGSGGIIEIGNVINSGHWSSFLPECPGPSAAFDNGGVTFGGLNKPREQYDAPPPLDMSGFQQDVIGTLLPYLADIRAPPLEGEYCQSHGLTPLGESLIRILMARGLIIDVAHLPRRALGRAYELLEAADYPATKTHGDSNDGRLYALGGLTGVGFPSCGQPGEPGRLVRGLTHAVQEAVARGAYAAEALSFDLNGFAGGRGPRFGAQSGCVEPQDNPVTWPFTSYDGAITFHPPRLGERVVDFNTEGMLHIGLLPELIEDVRRDGATDADLEPLFRSAEAYVRLWERAEARAAR